MTDNQYNYARGVEAGLKGGISGFFNKVVDKAFARTGTEKKLVEKGFQEARSATKNKADRVTENLAKTLKTLKNLRIK